MLALQYTVRLKADLDADLIVNLQGDAPLTPAWFVEDLIAAMKSGICRSPDFTAVARSAMIAFTAIPGF